MKMLSLALTIGFGLVLAVLLLFIHINNETSRHSAVVAKLEQLGCRVSLRYNTRKEYYYRNVTIFAELSSRKPSLLEALRQLHHVVMLQKLTIEKCVFDDEILDVLVGSQSKFVVDPIALELVDCEIRKDDLVRIKRKWRGSFIWSNSAEQREIIREVFGDSARVND